MASTSACASKLEKLKLADPSCSMGGSTDSEYQTALATEAEHATTSSSLFLVPAGSESRVESSESVGKCSVEQKIKQSKPHWSELAEFESDSREEEIAADNVEVFETLQSHPTWGAFFHTFGYELRYASAGSLVVGEKFAEGGQAELFHAQIKWRSSWRNEDDQEHGREWVLKVFKKGTLLRHLQNQWPHGMLQSHAEAVDLTRLGKPQPIRYRCEVACATLLEDGRFAFLMIKESEDLRSLIDRKMKLKTSQDCGPFSKDLAEHLMWVIAKGMHWFHSRNIVHRDLKASNVLVGKGKREGSLPYYVADYECSIGVIGTGFFRAPEILQACKDRCVNRNPELFTNAVDVYSYGMTCYEILTGKLPFEDHPLSENSTLLIDLVINQHLRPLVPEYVDNWAHELLRRCWQANPVARPSFREILSLLVTNSRLVRELDENTRKEEEEEARYKERIYDWDLLYGIFCNVRRANLF